MTYPIPEMLSDEIYAYSSSAKHMRKMTEEALQTGYVAIGDHQYLHKHTLDDATLEACKDCDEIDGNWLRY